MPETAVQAGIEPLGFIGEHGELDNLRALEVGVEHGPKVAGGIKGLSTTPAKNGGEKKTGATLSFLSGETLLRHYCHQHVKPSSLHEARAAADRTTTKPTTIPGQGEQTFRHWSYGVPRVRCLPEES
jgi:hypothetical protein